MTADTAFPVTVRVTAALISAGRVGSFYRHPIAQALANALPATVAQVRAYPSHVAIWIRNSERAINVAMPLDAFPFLRSYDLGLPVGPLDLVFLVPGAVLAPPTPHTKAGA